MKFGVREICDVVFKALHNDKIGSMDVKKGQPVLFIDSAKTSTIEGAATTVYAQGGRGNSRLLTWEGEKTLTFTVEDALLSEVGFAILSGAGLFDNFGTKTVKVHCTEIVYPNGTNLELEHDPAENSPVFVMEYIEGSVGKKIGNVTKSTAKTLSITNAKEVIGTLPNGQDELATAALPSGIAYFVDYYYTTTSNVTELQIDAENFAGHYYVEASTLFRREIDGKDLPAEIVFPKVKIQSNFTFNMASTGDPSTFTFTMDAMPAYTMFNKEKKVLCAIQVINDDINDDLAAKAQAVTAGDADSKYTNNDSITG